MVAGSQLMGGLLKKGYVCEVLPSETIEHSEMPRHVLRQCLKVQGNNQRRTAEVGLLMHTMR